MSMSWGWRCVALGLGFLALSACASKPRVVSEGPHLAAGGLTTPSAGRSKPAEQEHGTASAAAPDLYAETPSALGHLARNDVDGMLQRSGSSPGTGPIFRPGSTMHIPSDPLAIEWIRPGVEPLQRLSAHEPADAPPSQPSPPEDDGAYVPGPLFRREDEIRLSTDEADFIPTEDGAAEEPAGQEPRPSESSRNDRVGELIVELARELHQASSYADTPLRELFAIAAHAIVRPERALAAEAIPGLSQREREILEGFQGFCRQLGEGLDGRRAAEDVLIEAVAALRSSLVEHPLTVRHAALCWRIDGFGDYDAFDRNVFLAHDEQRVILYLEIDGFTSQPNEKDQWVTELSQQLVMYSDHDGIPVWTADWQPAVDVSQNQRQDFFTVQVFTLPRALSVGRYHLKVRLRDERSGAETEASLPLEMVADEKLAARVP